MTIIIQNWTHSHSSYYNRK